jgi:hypothetical protein
MTGLRRAVDGRIGPPESIDAPPIDIETAAGLMSDVGFVVFRTPPGSSAPESCLMVLLHDAPTRRHFDAEVVTYWVARAGRGQLATIDRAARLPVSMPYSWGRIRILDRLGARNSFVSFGGTLSAESVGEGARLLIFRSPALILRLPGHSQREDRLAEEVMTFFGRPIPHLWTADTERLIAAALPLDVYAAFLLHTQARIASSPALRRALSGARSTLRREIAVLEESAGDRLAAGRQLLAALQIPLDAA